MNSLGKIDRVTPAIMAHEAALAFTIEHSADYVAAGRRILLTVLLLKQDGHEYAVITDRSLPAGTTFSNHTELASAASLLGAAPICLTEPLPLTPVYIAKPWGQEIWYSGIEKRGVSTVYGTPISWLLDVFGDFLGSPRSPMLLKILDPFPAPNLGDLYFEMHEKKVEVYVVTHIDKSAWPDGKGWIRYGFNQDRIRQFTSLDGFKSGYVAAVEEYRLTRRAIDEKIRHLKAAAGIPAGEPLDPAHYEQLLVQVDPGLVKAEQKLRANMYEYTATRELAVGDVVTVRPMVPHSLQHGVRVIEFQTPHYERYILSFGQEVLTQEHWDTRDAIKEAITSEVVFKEPAALAPGQACIADFNEFSVTRITVEPGDSVESAHIGYTIVIGVTGTILFNGTATVSAEEAFFSPPRERSRYENLTDSPATLLVAEERSNSV